MSFNDRFVLGEKLGEGSYGMVYKAQDKKKQKEVAIKIVKQQKTNDGISSSTLREISLIKKLDHENIIKLEEYWIGQSDNQIHLVFDCMRDDLRKYLQKNYVSMEQTKQFMKQILSAVSYMNENGVLHRDIKPANILIDQNNQLKIGDFGLSRSIQFPLQSLSNEIQTLWYRSPEILLGTKQYGATLDTWSIGCIFAELINGKPLFQGDSQIDQILKIFQILGTPTPQSWPEVYSIPHMKINYPQFIKQNLESLISTKDQITLNLLESMLTLYPGKRITAKQALLHPYFQ